MRVIITGNIHQALDAEGCGGMEYSTHELAALLGRHARVHGWEVILIAEEHTTCPEGVTLVPVTFSDCPSEYERYGGGAAKWICLTAEHTIAEVIRSLPRCDSVIHDNSATVSVPLVAAVLGIPCARTVRLMPWHPAYASSANSPCHVMYLSDFQRQADRWRSRTLPSEVLPDYVPVPFSLDASESEFAVSIGRVEPRKGHLQAYHVAQRLGWSLAVIGPITDHSYAQQLADLPNLLLCTDTSRHSVLKRIAGARAVIWTPEAPEPGGRIVIEALRLGTPVIGRPYGYIADLVTGFGALAGARRRSIGNHMTESVYELTNLPSEFTGTPDTLAGRLFRVYESLLVGGHARTT